MVPKSILYLRVTIANNFAMVQHTLAKFCTQTRVVYMAYTRAKWYVAEVSYLSENFTFSKILQPHLLSRAAELWRHIDIVTMVTHHQRCSARLIHRSIASTHRDVTKINASTWTSWILMCIDAINQKIKQCEDIEIIMTSCNTDHMESNISSVFSPNSPKPPELLVA